MTESTSEPTDTAPKEAPVATPDQRATAAVARAVTKAEPEETRFHVAGGCVEA